MISDFLFKTGDDNWTRYFGSSITGLFGDSGEALQIHQGE